MDPLQLPKISDLHNESDVEQKFIYSILTADYPVGFGYDTSNFRTKPDIRQLKIDKGKSEKIYYPDYIINENALPLLIIEAKSPSEGVDEAFREASLYSLELNKQFPHGINPCKKILVTNGKIIIAGYFDNEKPVISLSYAEISTVSVKYSDLVNFCCKSTILEDARLILSKTLKHKEFHRPLSLVGGKIVQNTEVKPNTFGETISLEYKGFFNPESAEERKLIVENAYVSTRKHLRHIDPIDKIIRATKPINSGYLNEISDTSNPIEITSILQRKEHLKNQLILLIGTVGSGKSTFTDYLKNVAIDEGLKAETVWITLNLNQAPLNRTEIYNWLKQSLIQNLQEIYYDVDCEDRNILVKIYEKEFKALRKGPASFFEAGTEPYLKLLADKLVELESNLDLKAKAYIRYFCTQRNKLPVLVLDNCDKRNLEDQLLMFDVANWLKEEYSALVFLPLRDTTYNLYRKNPPLDTVIKDFVFRIEPPLLREVIYQRVKYILRIMPKVKGILSYNLPNDIRVEYPASDQGKYLASILRSLFENIYFSRLITGLAGRDIRKGLEIFLDFCKSGHITETDILKIKQSEGQEILQNHIVSRVLLRGNLRYYNEDVSLIKNLFHSFKNSKLPNPFCRLGILLWLKNNYSKQGKKHQVNYFKISIIFKELISAGFNYEDLQREFQFLIYNKLIITESQSEETFKMDELAALAPPGVMHLELLNDINYFAAVSEDVIYNDIFVAETIAKRITDEIGHGIYSQGTTVENANDLIVYLKKYKSKELLLTGELYLNDNKINDYYNLTKPFEIIKKLVLKLRETKKIVDYNSLEFKPSERIECEVVSVQSYGLIVEFGLSSSGLIHISSFRSKMEEFENIEIGDRILAEILEYTIEHRRYKLKYIELL